MKKHLILSLLVFLPPCWLVGISWSAVEALKTQPQTPWSHSPQETFAFAAAFTTLLAIGVTAGFGLVLQAAPSLTPRTSIGRIVVLSMLSAALASVLTFVVMFVVVWWPGVLGRLHLPV